MQVSVSTYTTDDEELEASFDVYPLGDTLQADFLEAYIAPIISSREHINVTRQQLVNWGLYTELYEDALSQFDWSAHYEQVENEQADMEIDRIQDESIL